MSPRLRCSGRVAPWEIQDTLESRVCPHNAGCPHRYQERGVLMCEKSLINYQRCFVLWKETIGKLYVKKKFGLGLFGSFGILISYLENSIGIFFKTLLPW